MPLAEGPSDTDHPSSNAVVQEVTPVFNPGRSFVLAFASICIITLAAALDATSLSIALPVITERLDGTAIQAFWSGTSFLVASAVVQPVIGGLSHGFGRKQVHVPRDINCKANGFPRIYQLVLASALLFAVGSLIAALAINFIMMSVSSVAAFSHVLIMLGLSGVRSKVSEVEES
ncbi:MAG: hypothetical protein Q9173_005754 [Seirophora scorigena]